MIPELNSEEFESFCKKGVVLIDFFADWCPPCKAMSPIVEELSKKYKGKVKIGKVGIDENKLITQKYGIMSIPTFIIFKNGEVLEQFAGAIGKDELENKMKNFL